jgi:hypothetical protein
MTVFFSSDSTNLKHYTLKGNTVAGNSYLDVLKEILYFMAECPYVIC